MSRIISIERISSRPGGHERPSFTAKGYQLADPRHGSEKHHAKHAVHVKTLDEAADLIARGFSIWMSRPGKRASLISPGSLKITRS